MEKKITIITVIIMLIIELLTLDVKGTNFKVEPSFYSCDITYKWEYHKGGDVMTYGLYTPSNANEFSKIPLILYLHGADGAVVSEKSLKKTSLPGIWNKWKSKKFENFSAYVLCPNLSTPNGSWKTPSVQTKVKKLLDKIISEYNIDKEHIIVCGESRGGTGALYYAYTMPEYFSKCVAFSPFYKGPFNTNIDTLCFYSYTADDAAKSAPYLIKAFGKSRVFNSTGCGHGSVGQTILRKDEGKFGYYGKITKIGTKNNKRSDLIEWMFKEYCEILRIDSYGLNEESVTLPIQQTIQLKVVGEGLYGYLVWNSSDKTVAEVNEDGVVTALKPGQATITARILYGPEAKLTGGKWIGDIPGEIIPELSPKGNFIEEENDDANQLRDLRIDKVVVYDLYEFKCEVTVPES